MKKAFQIFTILLISLNGTAQFSTALLSVAPEPVSNNSVCGAEINGVQFVYSFGGIDTTKKYSGIHNRCYKYDVQSNNWSTLPDLPTSPTRIAHGASVIKNRAYIIGGYHVLASGNEQSSNLVHILDLQADTFLANGANLPRATDDHVQATYKDSLIYVITGWSQTANIPDVQIYNPELDTWLIGTSIPNTHYYKSFGASGNIIGDTIYYFGGASMGSNFPIQNLIRKGYINPNNITDITWSIDTISANIVGYRMASAIYNNQLIWIGGSNQTYNYNGIAYQGGIPVEPNHRILTFDPNSNEWTTTYSSEINMDYRGLASFGCSYYLVGGMTTNQTVSNQCLKLFCTPNNIHTVENNNVELFPNPTKSMLNISSNATILSVQIFNLNGELIMNQSPKSRTTRINLSNTINGLYLVNIHTSEGAFSKKVVHSK